MHAPRPITPLSFDLVVHTLAEGFTKAQAEYDCPIMVTAKEINHYFYVAFHPIPDEAEIAAPACSTYHEQARHQGAHGRQDVGGAVEARGHRQERCR